MSPDPTASGRSPLLQRPWSRRGVLAGATTLGAAALGAAGARPAHAMSAATAERTQTVAAEPLARQAGDERLFQFLSASDLHPTGYYLAPGQSLRIRVSNDTASEYSKIVVGAPDGPTDPDQWASREYDLRKGSVRITDPYGGPLYWKVIGTTGYLTATLGDAAEPMPYFIHGTTTESEFQQQLDSRDTPYVQLVTAHALISMQREAALRFRDEDHLRLLSTFEEMIRIEDGEAGLDDTTATHARLANRYHFVTRMEGIDGIGAFAKHGHMLFPEPILDRLLMVDRLRLRGWGPYHELGHQHQQTPYRPTEFNEVTVNIYSLAVNRAFWKYGQSPRLHDPESNGKSVWESAPPKIGADGVNFIDDFTGMEKLVMFEQLRLAYGSGFQPTVHRLVRDERPDPGSWDDPGYRLGNFALYYSKAAGHDLREFFAKWGLPYDPAFDDRIAALGLPTPDRDLTAIRDEEGAARAAHVMASPELRRRNGLA